MILTSILTLISSLIITYVTIPILIKFAEFTSLYTDSNHRTCHKHKVPSLGGIALFMGICFSSLLLTPNDQFGSIQYLLATQFIIFFLGLKDDIFVLSARKKLLVQIICAQIIFFYSGVRIDNFYNVLGIGELNIIQSNIITTLTFVGLINAFNLIDGINWLAGLISISACLFLAAWFSINGFQVELCITLSLIGSLLAFLKFNKTPAKIFMGDTGSLLIGLTISYLLIRFINLNHKSTDLVLVFRSAPSIAIAVVFVPLLDTLRVMFIRILEKKSPFTPDQNHLHHILLKKGLSHIQAALILFAINTACIIIAIALHRITGKIVITSMFIVLFTFFNLITFNRMSKKYFNITI
ncbi:MraY family glycosyltransferase [Halobacteriovorax sp. DA5]|uniref:MraY family glycosyltransferase n=1 Tax=Halobacteriovorax sp. DA5 TaxID=2067553 RepID=UPI000CD2AAAF|nr:MraY family glycosyltransferase [Halobacteriovorax sp. DA5]POB13208.1 undecaprenyl/decaprenyl-phosphate alpha-N-acetylglucosaminyl 1-phosphate transferase [Halobacteriovorax sp. DA5]